MLFRAIIVIQKWIFRSVFSKVLKWQNALYAIITIKHVFWYTNVCYTHGDIKTLAFQAWVSAPLSGGPADVNASKNMFDPYILTGNKDNHKSVN